MEGSHAYAVVSATLMVTIKGQTAARTGTSPIRFQSAARSGRSTLKRGGARRKAHRSRSLLKWPSRGRRLGYGQNDERCQRSPDATPEPGAPTFSRSASALEHGGVVGGRRRRTASPWSGDQTPALSPREETSVALW